MQDGIYDTFVPKLVEAFRAVKVGDPMDMSTQMGSQINERQLQKILACVEDGVSQGAQIAVGGRRASEKGAFMQPTLLVGVTNDMRVAREEIFGPVAVVIRFRTEDEGAPARRWRDSEVKFFARQSLASSRYSALEPKPRGEV